MLRKTISAAIVAALLLTLCGCTAKAKANMSYTGTVSAITADSITLETNDSKVTIQLTSNTQFGMGGFGGFGQMPEGDWTKPAGGKRPERGEKPQGDFEKPEGDFQLPEGQMPNFEGSEMPDFSQFSEDNIPEGMTPPEGSSFEGFRGSFGGMDISSIPVGTSVTVTTGADKTAVTISLSMNFRNFNGQMPNSQN